VVGPAVLRMLRSRPAGRGLTESSRPSMQIELSMSRSAVHHPVFARLWSIMSQHEPRDIRKHRDELLAGLSGRVIEIGAGTGSNFAHYPPSVDEVVAVEPEPYLRRQAQAAAARAGVRIEVHDGVAERLPADDARLTRLSHVWCSAASPAKNLHWPSFGACCVLVASCVSTNTYCRTAQSSPSANGR